MPAPLVVLDTSVVTAAVLGSPGGPSARVINKIPTGGIRPAISNDYLDELEQTMSKPRIEEHASVGKAVGIALTLAFMGKAFYPHRHDWPIVTDIADWWMLDLAYESGADYIVTWDIRHLGPANSHGFDVLTPLGFLASLTSSH